MPRLEYSRALAELAPDAIIDCLAADIEIRVAVHDGVLAGVDAARFLFSVLAQELEWIEIEREIVEDDDAVVLFRAAIRGIAAQGLNHLRLDDAGKVRELTVFFRPLAALEVIAEVVGSHMRARFGGSGN